MYIGNICPQTVTLLFLEECSEIPVATLRLIDQRKFSVMFHMTRSQGVRSLPKYIASIRPVCGQFLAKKHNGNVIGNFDFLLLKSVFAVDIFSTRFNFSCLTIEVPLLV